MDKNKTTKLFGQTTKRCLAAAGVTFQNHESEFPNYKPKFSDYDWRSSTWKFQTTNGPNIQLRNQNSRGQRTTCSKPLVLLHFLSPTPELRRRVWGCWLIVQHEPIISPEFVNIRTLVYLIPLSQGSRRTPPPCSETRVGANNGKRCPLQSSS